MTSPQRIQPDSATDEAAAFGHRASSGLLRAIRVCLSEQRLFGLPGFGLAANLLFLAFYLLIDWPRWFSSDAATKSLLAGEILRSGTLFPPDFHYVNGDLWLVHGHLALVPLIALLGNTVRANALSSLVLLALLLLTVELFLRRIGIGVLGRLIALCWLTTGFSRIWAVMMFGEAAYGYWCLVALLALWATIDSFLQQRASLRTRLGLAGAAFLVGLYGTRGLVSVLVPATVGVAGAFLSGSIDRPPSKRIAFAGASWLGGVLTRTILLNGLQVTPFSATLVDQDHLRDTLNLEAIVHLFGLLPRDPFPISDPSVVLFPLRLVVLVALLSAVAFATVRIRRLPPGFQVLVLFHWTWTIFTLYLTFTVPRLAGQGHYLVPPTFTAILVASAALDRIRWNGRAVSLVGVATLVMLTLSFHTYVAKPAPGASSSAPPEQRWSLTGLHNVLTVLRENGIERAFSTYWHAGTATVLSGGEIEVYPVGLVNGLPVPTEHLSSDRWYLPMAAEPTALFLRREQLDGLDSARLADLVGPPRQIVEAGEYTVFVFEGQRLHALPSWKKLSFESLFADRLELGPYDLYTENGVGIRRNELLESTGRPGALVYGPHVDLEPGVYRVELTLSSQGIKAPGKWDFSAREGRTILEEGLAPPAADWKDLTVERALFVADERVTGFEGRLFVFERGELRFHRLVIERCQGERPSPAMRLSLAPSANGVSVSSDVPSSCRASPKPVLP